MLHGTNPCSDKMLKVGISNGMYKINQNRAVRIKYMKFVEENNAKLELTELQTKGVEVYSKEIERMMSEVLGSAGKA